MATLGRQASRRFLVGLESIGLDQDRIPNLRLVNARLRDLTGWSAVPVPGYLPAPAFFASLAQRRFPTTITIRSPDSLDFTPEPDIFHDVFGHVPLHADPTFARYLQAFGRRAAAATGEVEIERLARLFWFTVEFGLVREEGQVRIYGSGLISSAAEAAHALGESCQRRRFTPEAAMSTSFLIDRLQPVLYLADDFEQLFEALDSV
jgi:phenylalanine-4-hydroxylase